MAKDQKDLPGMESRSIEALDEKCREYDKVKKKRMDLTRREVELQADMLTLLKKHKITHYFFQGIEADLVVEKEKVKVRIHTEKDEAEEAA